jgi:hypothetical protein
VAATGILKNAKTLAHGYGGKAKQKSKTNTWHFLAKMFMILFGPPILIMYTKPTPARME